MSGLLVTVDTLLPAELVAAARRVVDANRKAGRRIALAESCTGGLVAAALTEIPGASEVFEGGIVAYSNETKLALLDVSLDVLETFGAVSIATAWSMAQQTIEATGADVSVAITGIAGPGGATDKKPVGLVVFARAEKGGDPANIFADKREFGPIGRGGIRLQAALCALDLLMPSAE